MPNEKIDKIFRSHRNVGVVATTVISEYFRLQEFHGAVITWIASSTAADIIIITSAVWSLYRRKNGIQSRTDVQISKIMRLTVQTSAITAISTAADVLIFLLLPLNSRAGWNNASGAAQDTQDIFLGNLEMEASNKPIRITSPSGVYELEPYMALNREVKGRSSYDIEDASSSVIKSLRLEDGVPKEATGVTR
ncbi:hypothetical protein BDQ12DRAFT_712472 [Crucibulum laeve]|uniref:DUF6534 domain-containing protein n=1 Tax=Crucibulum laeve TaxID=68775 RepID=A0A5C3M3I1_9AGAR|nr:hypothetical protein BDQ12DRAFT_712472 [Crucibulum laeve]